MVIILFNINHKMIDIRTKEILVCISPLFLVPKLLKSLPIFCCLNKKGIKILKLSNDNFFNQFTEILKNQ